MPRNLEITHFTQLPSTEVVCGAGRERIIRHYPGGQNYLEWQGEKRVENRFVGNEPDAAKTLVEKCRRCLDEGQRDCDIRPQYPGRESFSYEPQPIAGEVLVPYRALFEMDQLENILLAASQAGLKSEVLTRPGGVYESDFNGERMICPKDKVRVSIGEGKFDEEENQKMMNFWNNWHVLSGEFEKRETELRSYMQDVQLGV